ncbi:MAG: DinB family protein [Maribacter sp.]|uniref:DinB family protein n=1 Tax=Maribacter sp. TaxID=1897614 RepID=UPI003299C565
MKKIILPLVALVMVSFGPLKTGITDAEREMTIKELTKSHDRLTNAIEGLSETQLNFKASAESWSVAECVEHLAISEGMLGGMLQGALKTPADASKRDSVQISDEKLLGMITSRAQKVKTNEAFEPSGKFGSFGESLKEFKDKRKAHIEYVKMTSDDLRNHYGKLPFGTIDGVQIILFMSGHTERHVAQMEEVMANADFPKE